VRLKLSIQFLFSFVGHCFVFFFARFITNGIYFSCCFFILFIGFFRGIFTPFLGSIFQVILYAVVGLFRGLFGLFLAPPWKSWLRHPGHCPTPPFFGFLALLGMDQLGMDYLDLGYLEQSPNKRSP
jgi:hypothetical protein